MLALAEKGLGYDAGAVARVLIESTNKLSWVGKNESRAQVSVDETVFDHEDMTRRWKALGIPVSSDTERLVIEQAGLARSRYSQVLKSKKGFRNSGRRPDELPKLREMVRCVQSGDHPLDPDEFYDLHYKSLCISAHPDIRSLFDATEMRGLDHWGGVLVQVCLATIQILELVEDALAPAVNFGSTRQIIADASTRALELVRAR